MGISRTVERRLDEAYLDTGGRATHTLAKTPQTSGHERDMYRNDKVSQRDILIIADMLGTMAVLSIIRAELSGLAAPRRDRRTELEDRDSGHGIPPIPEEWSREKKKDRSVPFI